jgi:hypothetical protein
MVNDAERELGGFVRRFETDAGRQGRAALVGLLVGAAGAGAAVPLIIAAVTGEPAASSLAGIAGGIGLGGLYWGGLCLARLLLRRSQVFRLREGGLAYEHEGYFRLLRWAEIRSVTDHGRPGWFGELAGWDVYCVVRPVTGRRIVITGHTPGASGLSEALHRAVHRR